MLFLPMLTNIRLNWLNR